MYGYSFGAAAANVWHKTDYTAMLYPSYMPYTVAGALVSTFLVISYCSLTLTTVEY